MALSRNVLMPEHISVSVDASYDTPIAAAHPAKSPVRLLYAAVVHNQQLRELHTRLIARCMEFEYLYHLAAKACECSLRQQLKESSSVLKELLEQLAISTQKLKPALAKMELPPPVLSSMAGNWKFRKAFPLVKDNPKRFKALLKAVARQSRLLLGWVESQKAYVRHMAEVCSTQHVASLMSTLLTLNHLSTLPVHNDVLRALRGHLFRARVQWREGVPPTAPSQGGADAAEVICEDNSTPDRLPCHEKPSVHLLRRNDAMRSESAAVPQGGADLREANKPQEPSSQAPLPALGDPVVLAAILAQRRNEVQTAVPQGGADVREAKNPQAPSRQAPLPALGALAELLAQRRDEATRCSAIPQAAKNLAQLHPQLPNQQAVHEQRNSDFTRQQEAAATAATQAKVEREQLQCLLQEQKAAYEQLSADLVKQQEAAAAAAAHALAEKQQLHQEIDSHKARVERLSSELAEQRAAALAAAAQAAATSVQMQQQLKKQRTAFDSLYNELSHQQHSAAAAAAQAATEALELQQQLQAALAEAEKQQGLLAAEAAARTDATIKCHELQQRQADQQAAAASTAAELEAKIQQLLGNIAVLQQQLAEEQSAAADTETKLLEAQALLQAEAARYQETKLQLAATNEQLQQQEADLATAAVSQQHGDELLAAAHNEKADLQQAAAGFQQQLNEAHEELQTNLALLKQTQQKLDGKSGYCSQLEEQRRQLQTHVSELQSNLDATLGTLIAVKQELELVDQRLTEATAEKVRLQGNWNDTVSRLRDLAAAHTELQQQHEALVASMSEQQQSLADVQQQLQQAKAEAAATAEALDAATNNSRKTCCGWVKGALGVAGRVVAVAAASVVLGTATRKVCKSRSAAANNRS